MEIKQLPVHPGEILIEEFLKPSGVSQNRLALDLNIPVTRVNQIVKGTRGVSMDTAMRLARYFGTTPVFWLNLQTRYELDVAEDERAWDKIVREVRMPPGERPVT